MIGYRGAWFFVNRPTNTLKRVTFPIVLIGALMAAGAARAQAPYECKNERLQIAGDGQPLKVTGKCVLSQGLVPDNLYRFGDVNVLDGGSLEFEESSGSKLDLWASSILVENGGSLIAGTPASPFGTGGGVLTIHLYGAYQGVSGVGITCKSALCVRWADGWSEFLDLCRTLSPTLRQGDVVVMDNRSDSHSGPKVGRLTLR
jgi:G8 domain